MVNNLPSNYDNWKLASPYDENSVCLRCYEEEAEEGNDLCEYCEEILRERNRDRFIADETY